MRVEQEGFHYTSHDFINPKCFSALHALLGDPKAGSKATVYGDDGNIEIVFQWREEGDIQVAGRFPPDPESWDFYTARNPLLLRTQIKTVVQFELLLDPTRVAEQREELERLLDYIRAVEEENSK